MNAKVILTITSGSRQGESFEFSENTSFLVGRAHDCRINLPDDDLLVSRHHFMLDVNPPHVYLRDLGSRNGTYINEVKLSSRQNGDSPVEGAQPESAVIELKHLDIIRIGETTLRVEIEQPVVCASCGEEITEDELAGVQQHEGEYLCLRCLSKEPWLKEISPPAAEEDGMAILIRMLEELREPTDQPPEILGYEMVKLLGKGRLSTSKVFLLRNLKSGKEVELNIMDSRAGVREDVKVKFQREIKILKELCHPHLVEFYEQGETDGTLYYLREHCSLGSADQWAKERGGVLPWDEAGAIILQSLKGLAFMHQQGYVHRDVNPYNIMLTGSKDNPIAKLTGFYLAKNLIRDQASLDGCDEQEGEVAGTSLFISRDQVMNYKYAKPPVDVWSLGATFYYLVTGEFPRNFEQRKDPILQVLENPVVPVRQRDSSIPKAVAEVIDTALSDDAKARYQDGTAMLAALKRALEAEKQSQLASLAPEIPGYEAVRQLEGAGIGRVYLLRHLESGRQVCMKTLDWFRSNEPEFKEQFQREIDTMKALSHSNLVEIYEQGEADGIPYILMEYCELGSSEQWAEKRGGVLSLDEAAAIILQALNGLAYLHQQGYVHRDVAPQNILLNGSEGDPAAKLALFTTDLEDQYYVEMLHDPEYDPNPTINIRSWSRDRITSFKHYKPAIDVWSMGATFYHLLTGEYPRDFERRKDPILQVLQNPVVPVRKRDSSIPKAVAEVIDTALSDDVKQRYPDGGEMLASLEQALGDATMQIEGQPPSNGDTIAIQVEEDDSMAALMRMLEQLRQPPDIAPEIPGYETVKLLGEGGMGKVFLLRNKKSGKKVALKIMHARIAVRVDAKYRFQRNFSILMHLRHPNLVEFYEQGYADGIFYFLMEYCSLGSADLWAVKRGGVLSLDEAGAIMLQALKGLAFLHKNMYVHRDLKPQNILLTGSERKLIAKVTDYGLSKNFDKAGWSGMTMTGDVAGTVPFMPRDQVRNFKYAKPPVDVWSMGATFYNLLTGEFPRDFAPRKDPILQVLQNPVVPVRKRDSSIPKGVADVIDTALSDDVKNRYQDGGEMLAALEQALGDASPGNTGPERFWYD